VGHSGRLMILACYGGLRVLPVSGLLEFCVATSRRVRRSLISAGSDAISSVAVEGVRFVSASMRKSSISMRVSTPISTCATFFSAVRLSLFSAGLSETLQRRKRELSYH